jgi:hypothetical protein
MVKVRNMRIQIILADKFPTWRGAFLYLFAR